MSKKEGSSQTSKPNEPLGRTENDASNTFVLPSEYAQTAQQLADRARQSGRYAAVQYNGSRYEVTYHSGKVVIISPEMLSRLIDN